MKLSFYSLTLVGILLLAACGGGKADDKKPADSTQTDSVQAPKVETAKAMMGKGEWAVARGNEPFWSATLYNDRSLSLSIPDVGEKAYTNAKIAQNGRGGVVITALVGKGKNVIITLDNTPCQDAGGVQFTYTATMVNEGKTYKGCGEYVGPTPQDIAKQDSIKKAVADTVKAKTEGKPETPPAPAGRVTPYGQWSLKKLAGADMSKFPKKPFIDINPEGSISGNDGCNSLSGNCMIKGSGISISDLIQTKMYCDGVPDRVFTGALRNATKLRIEGGVLKLSNVEGNVIAEFIR